MNYDDNMSDLLNNFLEYEYAEQLIILDMIDDYLKSNNFKKVNSRFKSVFAYYYNNVKKLLTLKNNYKNLNSDERRYLRYTFLVNLEFEIEDGLKESDENMFRRYVYLNSYNEPYIGYTAEESTRYFKKNSKKVDVTNFQKQFNSCEKSEKLEFIKEFTNNYADINCSNFNSFPSSNKMLIEIKNVLEEICGVDLYEKILEIHSSIIVYCLLSSLDSNISMSEFSKYMNFDLNNKLNDEFAVRNQKRLILSKFN